MIFLLKLKFTYKYMDKIISISVALMHWIGTMNIYRILI